MGERPTPEGLPTIMEEESEYKNEESKMEGDLKRVKHENSLLTKEILDLKTKLNDNEKLQTELTLLRKKENFTELEEVKAKLEAFSALKLKHDQLIEQNKVLTERLAKVTKTNESLHEEELHYYKDLAETQKNLVLSKDKQINEYFDELEHLRNNSSASAQIE